MLRFLLAVSLLAQTQNASTYRVYPIDDTSRDGSFRGFVKKLNAATTAKDAKALRKLVDNDVVVGPGKNDSGWEKFVEHWKPEDKDSGVWQVLSDLLSLGFVREHPSLFVSPYLVWRFPRDLDLPNPLVVIRDKAPLRSATSVRSSEVAALSFDIVQQLSAPVAGDGLEQWVRVRTLDGQEGYLSTRDVMSPLMPRAQFAKQDGHWVMVALE